MANLRCGIVGLPNVGKSTLFNALTANQAEASNYPFCTIDPNVGVVEIPDPRLAKLSQLSKSKLIIPASMEFVDIAGLVEGASKGEGLGNKFLANIRETDAIVHVVRCFESEDITHVSGSVDPIRDIEVINLELSLADLQMVDNALGKVERQAKGDQSLRPTLEALKRAQAHLNENLPMRKMELSDVEEEALRLYPFLTRKKVLYVANVSEAELPGMDNAYVQLVREYAEREGNYLITICAQIEQEIAQLDTAEREGYLKELGLAEPGLERLIRAAFEILGLITYLTTGEKETRAWPIIRGSTAPEAAGKIHSDIQRGFIRAEIVGFDDMVACSGWAGARDKGKSRTEGRDYVMLDGDVVLFRHN